MNARTILRCRRAAIWVAMLWSVGAQPVGANDDRCVCQDRGRAATVYVGQHTDTRFVEIVQGKTHFRDSFVAALALSRTWARWGNVAVWDAEIQIAKHAGLQHHAEFNAAILLRWTRFPWDHRLCTSVALGIGPSIASSTPEIEQDRGKYAARRLAFMPFEISVGPTDARWATFVRVHHRSGVFDLVSRGSGSNFLAGGLRMAW